VALQAILACPERADHANAIGGIVDHEVFVGSESVQGMLFKIIERPGLGVTEFVHLGQVLRDIGHGGLMLQQADQFEADELKGGFGMLVGRERGICVKRCGTKPATWSRSWT